MRIFLFLFFAGFVVKCDESNNYYVIEMPEQPRRDVKKPFRVYWNVPTTQCKSKKIPFENLYQKYGIVQNTEDQFIGERISILYDPGDFPALLKNDNGQIRYRNGGVPQEGNLTKHIEEFRSRINLSIPDEEYKGIGIIDFESWRPVLRQNFGDVTDYKDVSYRIERKRHWFWPEPWIKAEAKQRFEDYARKFMQTSLSIAKQMRPKALWGYYGFPYCFNMRKNREKQCAREIPAENDGLYWLWSESSALYPSVYSPSSLTSYQLSQLITGRVREAARVRLRNSPILPYFWYKYHDSEGAFLSEEDLRTALSTFYNSEASGFIIWGSSRDVDTPDKCKKLLKYLEHMLGPAVSKYTLNGEKINAENEPLFDVGDLFGDNYTSSNEFTSTQVDSDVYSDNRTDVFDTSYATSTHVDNHSTERPTFDDNVAVDSENIYDITEVDTESIFDVEFNKTLVSNDESIDVYTTAKPSLENNREILETSTQSYAENNKTIITTESVNKVEDNSKSESNVETDATRNIYRSILNNEAVKKLNDSILIDIIISALKANENLSNFNRSSTNEREINEYEILTTKLESNLAKRLKKGGKKSLNNIPEENYSHIESSTARLVAESIPTKINFNESPPNIEATTRPTHNLRHHLKHERKSMHHKKHHNNLKDKRKSHRLKSSTSTTEIVESSTFKPAVSPTSTLITTETIIVDKVTHSNEIGNPIDNDTKVTVHFETASELSTTKTESTTIEAFENYPDAISTVSGTNTPTISTTSIKEELDNTNNTTAADVLITEDISTQSDKVTSDALEITTQCITTSTDSSITDIESITRIIEPITDKDNNKIIIKAVERQRRVPATKNVNSNELKDMETSTAINEMTTNKQVDETELLKEVEEFDEESPSNATNSAEKVVDLN